MLKYIFTVTAFFITACIYSQDNSKYFYKPFSIYKSAGQVIIAGDVNSFVYANYYGKDVSKENYNDPHAKPEYLVNEIFKAMKKKDLAAFANLYDETFDKKNFNANKMAEMTKDYTDIKLVSKFRSGDFIVIRYDFVSANKSYPFFASIRNIQNKYFLTTQINVSDPFNSIGSYSPNNLFERKAEPVNTKNMTAFYFIEKENKIFFSNQIPNEDHSSLYLAFEFYNAHSSSAEIDFLHMLQKAAVSDSENLKNLIAIDQLPLLSSDLYYGNYFYAELKKMFRNYSILIPMAALKINSGKIVYFKFGSPDESPLHMGSVILKKVSNRYYLGLRITDNDIHNILWNVYIREAIYDYFIHK